MLKVDINGKRILEIGWGMALVSHVLNSRGADITAMDIPYKGMGYNYTR
jgi:uncharacterized UPF0146 family protein